METFSIVKQFDEAKLREKILYFVHENGYNPYIFANHGTLEVLKKPYEQDITFNSVLLYTWSINRESK